MKSWRFALVGLLSLATTFAAAAAHAQGFQALASKDGVDVWAVGDAGLVYRSLDGGASYSTRTLGALTLFGVAHRGLNVIVVGAGATGGRVQRSTDNGGAFASNDFGTGTFRGIAWPSDENVYIVGDGGQILRSRDGGVTWSSQVSGTLQRLNAVTFTDSLNGWACGANGTFLRTTNGGTNWTAGAISTPVELFSVAQNGSTVWAVGADAAAFQSTNGGTSFAPVYLKVDHRPEVRTVALGGGAVWLGGGGGFLRKSTDGGATWTWPVHDMHGQTSAIAVSGTSLFAATSKARVVERSLNSGTTWSLPTGMALTRSWGSVTTTGSFRGKTCDINWYNPNILYIMRGSDVAQSRDRGETWASIATVGTPAIASANAFVVSDKDTSTFLAAVDFSAGGRGVIVSTDRGATWATKLSRAFGTYGIPLEQHPDKPDTMVFGGDNSKLSVSYDRGKNWADYGTKVFRSPCDIIIVPDANDTWQVGDGITGSGIGDLWQSTDTGANFTMRQAANGSEIPGMSIARARNNYSIGTTWSAAGVRTTSDLGATWPTVAGLSGYGSSWGTDIAGDDPNVQLVGQYSGGISRLSMDGGTNWLSISLSGTNYSFLGLDRANLFAEQSGTMYKMRFAYAYTPTSTQSLAVNSPNGGEAWAAGSTHAVTWNASNVALARIEWRRSAIDPWLQIGLIEGYLGTYNWLVPDDPTATAEVRVSDAFDASPIDGSNGVFTILAPRVVVTPGSHDFGTQALASATSFTFTVQSTGTSTLNVTSASTATTTFTEGRTSFSIGAGGSDTIAVTFRPLTALAFNDTLTLVTNAGTVKVALAGVGQATGSVSLTSPDGGEGWKYDTSHNITWSAAGIDFVGIDYRTAPANGWIEIATNVPAGGGSYAWTIPNAPTATAAVRVRDLGGSIFDLSTSTFAITVPAFSGAPAVLDLGDVAVGASSTGAFTIDNPGTAFLGVLSATSDRATFRAGRSAFNVNAASNDTLGITFTPSTTGIDSAQITFVTDDPASPHVLRVIANGTSATAVGGPLPTAFALGNQPNPFSSRTAIGYAIPKGTRVTLDVFDIQGHRIATLVDREQAAGRYTVPFGRGIADASGNALGSMQAGVYFYRLRTPEWTSTKRMLMVK